MNSLSFDPSQVAIQNGNYFGLPYGLDEAEIVILSAPWDVTTSYRDGTARGPSLILESSYQVDLFSPYLDRVWEMKVGTSPLLPEWLERNDNLRKLALTY